MTTMNYQLLGRSGLRVSDLCLGAMCFGDGASYTSSKQDSRLIYDAFREAGGNFIDTANVYTAGTSEEYLGEFIAGHRSEIVLATKYSLSHPGRGANAGGNHRKNMVESVEASLKRLGTDYIDLYWLHAWDAMTPAEEVMRALDDLVRAGKVLYAGVSDMPAWSVAKSNTLAELRGWTRYVGLQIEYSLLERTVERELIPMAGDQTMTVLAWSPLRGGHLSGKYLTAAAAGETARLDDEMMRGFFSTDDQGQRVVRETVAIAAELEVSPAQVALAWLRHRPVPVIPIIGARTMKQLQDNIGSLGVQLSGEHLKRLDEVSAVPLGFPMAWMKGEMVETMIYGGMRNRIRG